MNTTALNPIATRFAWKEYRTLRGFWLAALVIAALVQSTALVIHSGVSSSQLAELFFGIALAAAALYAVGVAATTFSMEHEDETYQYLSGLPTRWLPLFAGKLSFAFASSLALALALATCGWMLSGWNFPGREAALAMLGVFGFAIIEMLAWGIFFSLLLRQPLLAALLAIGAESLALTIAVNTFVQGNLPTLALSSYVQVLPARIAIAACVFAVDILLARRWLTHNVPRHPRQNTACRSPSAPHPALQVNP